MRKQLLLPIAILTFLVIATIVVIFYGRGYRFGFDKGVPGLSGTGLLVATSDPNGAQVFINNHLTTATDNTINLAPGEYNVRIFKEGYFSWEKRLAVKKEVVTKADALLLPTAPKLESITNVGVSNPILDPSQTKIAYTVASQSAKKNGIYILDMTTRPILTLQSSSTQITDETISLFSQAQLSWSPDGSELIATISGQNSNTIYLLKTNGFNQNPQDVTETMASVNSDWEKQRVEKEKARFDALPKKLKQIATDSFKILAWSYDETKILYQASSSGSIPIIITPRLIGVDSTPEQRNLVKGAVYVYDIKEDRNYKILDSTPSSPYSSDYWNPIMWFPDSAHLVYVHDQKVEIMEYDGGNQTTIYAGPFVDDFAFPWPDTSKVVILTNLGNPNIAPNLYTIGLK